MESLYSQLGTEPVLFVMAETNAVADGIGAHILDTAEVGFKKSEVLVIHTN